MIWKGRGRTDNLSDNRFVHCKEWFPRVAEALVVEEGLKTALVEESSIYQIGGQPSHRSEELMFIQKSIIAKYRQAGQCIIIQSYDVSKYFDKELIEDGVLTCLKRGADQKQFACGIY